MHHIIIIITSYQRNGIIHRSNNYYMSALILMIFHFICLDINIISSYIRYTYRKCVMFSKKKRLVSRNIAYDKTIENKERFIFHAFVMKTSFRDSVSPQSINLFFIFLWFWSIFIPNFYLSSLFGKKLQHVIANKTLFLVCFNWYVFVLFNPCLLYCSTVLYYYFIIVLLLLLFCYIRVFFLFLLYFINLTNFLRILLNSTLHVLI